MEQINSSATTVGITWDAPDFNPDGFISSFHQSLLSNPTCLVVGYYVTLDQVATTLITDTSITTGQTARQSAYGAAVSGASTRDDSGTLLQIVDGGSALSPANSFVIGVTGCLDCQVTDFAALEADDTVAAVTVAEEFCSYFSSITVYSAPELPTCSVVTESMTTLQVSAVGNATDTNAPRFTITRSDVDFDIANVSSADLPYADSYATVPGTEYVYVVYATYFGWKSEPQVCVGCTNPRPPTNVDGDPHNDTSIYMSWDDPVLQSVVDGRFHFYPAFFPFFNAGFYHSFVKSFIHVF